VLARRLYNEPLFGERTTGEMMPGCATLLTLGSVLGSVFDERRWCLVGVLNPPSSNGVDFLELLSVS